MAVKYWYRPGNGSSNFNTAGSWFFGPGGTGGSTTTPTSADDAVVNAASGSGTLTMSAAATINSLNLTGFTGTFAGTASFSISMSNNTNNNNFALILGGNHTYSGIISFSYPSGNLVANINCNGIFHKGGMNFPFSGVLGNWYTYNDFGVQEPIRLTGALTISYGYIVSDEVYAGTISSSNSNNRGILTSNLYLSGSGTLITTTTQTNLYWDVINVYLTNTTAAAKSFSIAGQSYITNLYLQGSGASLTTFTFALTLAQYPNVIISKTGGSFTFGTSYITDLIFIEGTTITWAGSSTIVIYGNVTLCNSMSISTSSPLSFQGGAVGGPIQVFTTFNKTFTGALTINDAGYNNTFLEVYGNYISTVTGTAISIGSSNSIKFFNSVSLTNGSIGISTAGSFPYVYFYGGIITANVISIIEAVVYLGDTTLQGALTLTSGNLYFLDNSVHNLVTFSSSSSINGRYISLGNNTTINLRGTVLNTWNTSQGLAQGVLYLDAQTSTINIVDQTGASVSFAGGGCEFYNLNINRSGTLSCQTTFSGSNFFRNFKDSTVIPGGSHTILFSSGTTTYIYDTFQVGNSTNLTYIYTTGSAFYLQKLNPGLVICPNVYIYNSNALNSNTWYAIPISSDLGLNTGWIFNTPPRRLGSLGAG
jgi:hypothetical protein